MLSITKNIIKVYADQIYPECDESSGMPNCQTGRWVTPLVMAMYLLVANILLINLLIAVFNNIFNDINAISHQVFIKQQYVFNKILYSRGDQPVASLIPVKYSTFLVL